MPGPFLWRISFATSPDAAEELAAALEPFCVSVAWFEQDARSWRVEGTAVDEPPRERIATALTAAAEHLGVQRPAVAVDIVPPADWAAANLSTFRPIAVGRYFVHGSHFQWTVPPGRIGLALDAGTAFGTGAHATTAGCLVAMGDLARRRRFSNVLDLGCGSGILAFAAARTWPCRALAVDVDPEAVRVAAGNARANRLGGRVRVVLGAGMECSAVRARLPYDLILANILARPLIRMAGPIAQGLAPGGVAILSGLVAADAPWLEAALVARGLRRVRRLVRNGWATLVFGRALGAALSERSTPG